MVCITVATTTYCKCSAGQEWSRAGREKFSQGGETLHCSAALSSMLSRQGLVAADRPTRLISEAKGFTRIKQQAEETFFSPPSPSQADRFNLKSVYCWSGFEAALPTREKQRLIPANNERLLFELRNRQMRRKHWRKCGQLENNKNKLPCAVKGNLKLELKDGVDWNNFLRFLSVDRLI